MRLSPQAATGQKNNKPEAPGEAANTAGSISTVKTSRAAGFERCQMDGLAMLLSCLRAPWEKQGTACVQLRQELQRVAFSSPHPQNAGVSLPLLSGLD